jgi:uncharacterized membrane protein HdeD (DUF308 family)
MGEQMNPEWVLWWAGTVLAGTGALLAITHVVMYNQLQWRETGEGQALMATIGLFGLVLSYVFLASISVTSPPSTFSTPQGIIRLAIFGACNMLTGRWLYLLIVGSRAARKEKQDVD